MKVENNPLNPINSQRSESIHARDKNLRPVDAAANVGSGDKAELSESARLLAKARQTLSSTPDVRSERVDELKTQVSNGTYTVPINDLVHILVSSMNKDK